jgi:trypsin-like peptidase
VTQQQMDGGLFVPRTARRVVMVRSAQGGSGYRISHDLVLTAAHAADECGEAKLFGSESWLPFRRVWHHDDLDVAVLKLEATNGLPTVSPVRWGLLSSAAPRVPVEAHGFPTFQALGEGAPRDYEQVDGHVNPMSGAGRRQFHVSIDSKLWRSGPHPWPGMSGAPVLCHGLPIGVTTEAVGDSERLAATPITEFIFDEGIQQILRASTHHDPVVVPADLEGIVSGSLPWQKPRSWVSLLRPTADVVPYRSQGDDLIDLFDWTSQGGFGACLLHGDTGVGKTRLAHELVRAVAARGGAAAFVNEFDVMSPDARDSLFRLTRLRHPTLLVIDYAETKPDLISPLIEHLSRTEDDQLPVKLLLVARSAGTWWDLVRQQSSVLEDLLHDAHVHRLTSEPLPTAQRARLFVEAVHGFAGRLPDIPECAGRDWLGIAQRVAAAASLPDKATGSPMSCQVGALTALLAAGSIGDDGVAQSTRDQLLAHERRYWWRVANELGFDKVPEGLLDNLVALVCLYGARTRADALAVLARYAGRDEPESLGRIAEFLVRILGRTSDAYWQPLHPSSLAEHLVVERIHAEPWVIVGTLPHVRDYQLVHALTLLSRAAPTDHALWTHVANVAKKHRQRMPFELLAGAAVAVPDSRGIAEVIAAAHRALRPDQLAVLAAFSGKSPTVQARRDLWNLYSQAYSNLPEAQLRRAASRAATILELLDIVRPGLTKGVVAGMEMLPLVSDDLDTLYNAFAEGGEFTEATSGGDYGYNEYAMQTAQEAREAARRVVRQLDQLSPYRTSFSRAPGVLDELGPALAELASEIADIRQRLDGLTEDFGAAGPN